MWNVRFFGADYKMTDTATRFDMRHHKHATLAIHIANSVKYCLSNYQQLLKVLASLKMHRLLGLLILLYTMWVNSMHQTEPCYKSRTATVKNWWRHVRTWRFDCSTLNATSGMSPLGKILLLHALKLKIKQSEPCTNHASLDKRKQNMKRNTVTLGNLKAYTICFPEHGWLTKYTLQNCRMKNSAKRHKYKSVKKLLCWTSYKRKRQKKIPKHKSWKIITYKT